MNKFTKIDLWYINEFIVERKLLTVPSEVTKRHNISFF